MTERYHCNTCGWDGDTPALAEESLGEAWLWTLRLCPDCGEEVYATIGRPPWPPEQF
jgi:hypothetical protein